MVATSQGRGAVQYKLDSLLTDDRPKPSSSMPKMTRGHAALVGLMHRYLRSLPDPKITLLDVHKLMYFLQEAGEPLKLKFQKAHHGPYAEELRQVLTEMDGHLISGFRDGGGAPDKGLKLARGAIRDSTAFLKGFARTRGRLRRVAKLIEGIGSPSALELLATVYWVATEHPSSTDEEIIAYTYAWGPNKRQFTGQQIKQTLKTLRNKGWLEQVSV